MSNSFLGKSMENARKSEISILWQLNEEGIIGRLNQTKKNWKNKISKNYVNNRYETETKLLMPQKVCLGLAKLDVRKIVMYEYLYDYIKPKYIKNKLMLHIYR